MKAFCQAFERSLWLCVQEAGKSSGLREPLEVGKPVPVRASKTAVVCVCYTHWTRDWTCRISVKNRLAAVARTILPQALCSLSLPAAPPSSSHASTALENGATFFFWFKKNPLLESPVR
jgi:hypothetical protein